MFIILKQSNQSFSESDEVLNVFYCKDLTVIRNWIKEYINQDIESYKYAPIEEDIKYLTYEINDGERNFELLKKYKRINRGYIYNSSERITDILYSISILEFNSETNVSNLEATNIWRGVNNEINNRVLKQLEKDTLLQILNSIQDKIHTKNNWNKTEFISLVSDTLREFKRDLYNTISKRVKRFNKRHSIYKNKPQVSCKIESLKNNY